MASLLWTKTLYDVCLIMKYLFFLKLENFKPEIYFREKLIWDCKANKLYLKKDWVLC